MNSVSSTLVITTKNRREDLRAALRSASEQTAEIEILVIDDGSTDGTAAMVRAEFPHVRLVSHEQSAGYIVRRNEGARLASAPIVFSIDDDAVFASPRTVEQTLREFADPRIGAVAIPFINVNQDRTVQQAAPSRAGIWLAHSYVGTAHALRRDVFLRLGGYQPFLFHQGEEGEFCLRMLAAGYATRLGSADPIHHLESPRRDFRRMDLYGRRNDVLTAWYNAPLSYLPTQLLGTTLKGLLFGLKMRRPLRMARGLAMGYIACLHEWRSRRPAPRKVYALYRRLKTQGPLSIERALAAGLPPLPDPGVTASYGFRPTDAAGTAPQ